MIYNEFLFSQLWMAEKDGEYDLMYGEMIRDYYKFIDSLYNDEDKSFYDCIVSYLNRDLNLLERIKSMYMNLINAERSMYPASMEIMLRELQENKYVGAISYDTAIRLMKITNTDCAYEIFEN